MITSKQDSAKDTITYSGLGLQRDIEIPRFALLAENLYLPHYKK